MRELELMPEYMRRENVSHQRRGVYYNRNGKRVTSR